MVDKIGTVIEDLEHVLAPLNIARRVVNQLVLEGQYLP